MADQGCEKVSPQDWTGLDLNVGGLRSVYVGLHTLQKARREAQARTISPPKKSCCRPCGQGGTLVKGQQVTQVLIVNPQWP